MLACAADFSSFTIAACTEISKKAMPTCAVMQRTANRLAYLSAVKKEEAKTMDPLKSRLIINQVLRLPYMTNEYFSRNGAEWAS